MGYQIATHVRRLGSGFVIFCDTSRDPDFVLSTNELLEPSLHPFYPQIQQAGIDVLALMGGWTIKFEGIQILAGMVQDLDYSNVKAGFVETSSRLNNYWRWRLDAWQFSSASDEPAEPSHLLRRDDYVQFSSEYYF